MRQRREPISFAAVLGVLIGGFFAPALLTDKVLSPADVLLSTASFQEVAPPHYEPGNRLLMDPVLQFEPWIEFNRAMLRSGRLPLWNSASGCGAPHLANGQAAVFDPFQMVAYLGTGARPFAWMAALRLWFAGLGMFFLARAWGLQRWGRWFAGLVYPFSGFLIVWLLYPVTNAAIWLPWVLLATHRVWDQATVQRGAQLAVAVAGTLLGGHVQTAAHVLLAAGANALWLGWRARRMGRPGYVWIGGVILGVTLAAIEVVPLGVYLTRSPVWTDREEERKPPWSFTRPRIFEMACVAMPSLYGSQRRGEPNLARVVGADNQNESAGSFAGLATLIWLAPLGWLARRENPRICFVAGLVVVGFAAAYRLPPVDNLLRSLPVLKVTDNRRLTHWVAFGLAILGGAGLDRLGARPALTSRWWTAASAGWITVGVMALGTALAIGSLAPTIRQHAQAHYLHAAKVTPGADLGEYQDRAERQTSATLRFVPRYLGTIGAELLLLTGLLLAYRSQRLDPRPTQAILLGLTLVELGRFGLGLNPIIEPTQYRPLTPLITALQTGIGRSGRIIGLSAEFPPNTLMRYGLADPRNYDSVETTRNLAWFQPLYDPEVRARTSRREISWERIDENRDRLRQAGVRAIVSATAPPPTLGRAERWGAVWVVWLDADPLVRLAGPGTIVSQSGRDGRFEVELTAKQATRLVVAETFDPGWRVQLDGKPGLVQPELDTFLAVDVPSGTHRVVLDYDPIEVRVAGLMSGFALILVVFALTGSLEFRSTRIVVPRLGRTQAFGLESDS